MNTRGIIFSALLLLVCACIPLTAQESASMRLRSGGEVDGFVLDAEHDSIGFTIGESVAAMLNPRTQRVIRVNRAQVQALTFGKTDFTGTGLIVGSAIGLVTGLAWKASLDREHKGQFFSGLPGMMALGATTLLGFTVGLIADLVSTSSGETLCPAQHRDYWILQDRLAHGTDVSQTTDESITFQHVFTHAAFDVPLVTVQTLDGRDISGYLLDVNASGCTVMHREWYARNYSGIEAEEFLAFDDISRITHDSPGYIVGGDDWSWQPRSGDPTFLRQYCLVSRHPEIHTDFPVPAPPEAP